MEGSTFWPRQVAAKIYEVILPLGFAGDGAAEAVVVLDNERWTVKLARVAVHPGQA